MEESKQERGRRQAAERLTAPEGRFEKHVDAGIAHAFALLHERFESEARPEDRLAFHNGLHTKDVVGRTERVLRVIQQVLPEMVTDRHVALGKLLAAYHDTVQEWTLEKGKRKRFIGRNETKSAEELLSFMRATNENAGEEVFTAEDLAKVSPAMAATVPAFDPEHQTVIQPGFSSSIPLEAQAVALADLGTAGMENSEKHLKEGDALFREENIDIGATFQIGEPISDEEKDAYEKRMRTWYRFQADFTRGRKELLAKETARLPEAAQEVVRGLFDKFDEAIDAAEKQAQERDAMGFYELAHSMGYAWHQEAPTKI